MGLTRQRIATLKGSTAKTCRGTACCASTSIIFAKLTSAYIEAGRYEDALNVLTENYFPPAEGDYGFWDMFVEAHVRLGVENLEEGRHDEARQHFQSAMEYPPNLGPGAPYTPFRREAMQKYWLGECCHAMGEKQKARETWDSMLIQKYLSPKETYYKGLALRRLGKPKEATKLFKDTLKEADRKEKRLEKACKKMPLEQQRLLNCPALFVAEYCAKMISYLGLGKKKEALAQFRKAQKITKDLGHYSWLSRQLTQT